MKILYFGYDLFSPCLEEILNNKNFEIIKIYSFKPDGVVDFNDNIKAIARKKHIEFTEEKITSSELKKQIEQNGAQLIFCAGYAYRIPIESVNIPAVNIHPSPLPRCRGPWPMPWAILNGEKTWAVTVHKLSPKIDEGDILLSKGFGLEETETYKTLEEKIKAAAKEITLPMLENLGALWQTAKKQGTGQYLPEPDDNQRTVFANTSRQKRELIERAFPQNYVIYK